MQEESRCLPCEIDELKLQLENIAAITSELAVHRNPVLAYQIAREEACKMFHVDDIIFDQNLAAYRYEDEKGVKERYKIVTAMVYFFLLNSNGMGFKQSIVEDTVGHPIFRRQNWFLANIYKKDSSWRELFWRFNQRVKKELDARVRCTKTV